MALTASGWPTTVLRGTRSLAQKVICSPPPVMPKVLFIYPSWRY